MDAIRLVRQQITHDETGAEVTEARHDGVTQYNSLKQRLDAMTNEINDVDNKITSAIDGLHWKESVNSFGDLAVQYPNPKEGWTASVNDTNEVYRYDDVDQEWKKLIDLSTIPKATQNADGLMSKEDKTKLDNIDSAKLVTTDGGQVIAGNLTVQGGIIGNSTTATALETPRNITLQNDVTGTAQFNGTADAVIDVTLANVPRNDTNVVENPNFGDAFTAISGVTSDAKGRITGVETKTVTLPIGVTTDEKVKNTPNDTVKAYITGTTDAIETTGTQVFDTGVYLDATAGHLTATQFNGSLNGNATTATTLATTSNIELQGDVTGTAPFDGSANATINATLANVQRNDTNINDNPVFGGTFTAISGIVSDAKGRVVEVETKTVTLPNPAQANDTNVTNTLDPTTRAYITGTTSDVTNTGQQIFDTGVYLDTDAGSLVAQSFRGDLTGNASTATTLETPRTITITGAVNGNADFDGSQNITIDTTNNIKVNIEKIRTKTQLATNQQTVAIGTTLQADDIVDVFLAGVRLEEGTHYTLDIGNSSISSVPGTTEFLQGDYFNFEVLRTTVTV